MGDQVLVLKRDRPVDFVADACAALADSVNEMRVWRAGNQLLIDTYAEMLHSYANLLRPALAADPGSATHLKVIDHLVQRLRQAQIGEITIPTLDIADRLHAELVRQPALV